MTQDQKCAVCQQQFTSSNIAWIISHCSHNICNQCLKKSIAKNVKKIRCLECEADYNVDKESLEEFPKNITILKNLHKNKDASQDCGYKKGNTGNQSTFLINHTNVSSPNSVVKNCTKHGKPLQIICTIDRELLCAHCAIFGGHQNHAFKTLQQFETELQHLKQEYKDFEFKKQICDEGIRGKKYRSAIVAKISQKKDNLVLEIKLKFQALYSAIKDVQSLLFDELVKCFRLLDTEISKVTRQQQAAQKYLSQWRNNMNAYLKQIQQSKDLSEKINAFYQINRPNIHQGQKLLKQLQQNNQIIRTSVTQKIDSVSIQYTGNIEGFLYNYAKINMNYQQIKGRDLQLLDYNPIMNQFDEMQQFKKTMKIQFVKSDDIGGGLDRVDPMGSTARGNILQRVKSNPKIPRTVIEKVDTPKKATTPEKMKRTDYRHEQNTDVADRMLNQFLKSSDTLDLSDCNLNDAQILHIVATAANKKPIKCIKLCKNKLTNVGLSRLIEYLPNITNINASYNLLNEDCIDLFIDNREYLPYLRIINLSHNKVNQRKIKTKIDELRRVGIITAL